MITCCKDCVAPKRHPGCHDYCKEYLKEKEEHERQTEASRKEKLIVNGIVDQQLKAINKLKDRRNKFKRRHH